MVMTAGTGLGLLTNSRPSRPSSIGTQSMRPRSAQVCATRKNFVWFCRSNGLCMRLPLARAIHNTSPSYKSGSPEAGRANSPAPPDPATG